MKKEVKRKVISLETKIEILDRLRKGDRVVDVAKSYSMNEATIRTIRTNETLLERVLQLAIPRVWAQHHTPEISQWKKWRKR